MSETDKIKSSRNIINLTNISKDKIIEQLFKKSNYFLLKFKKIEETRNLFEWDQTIR